MGGVEVLQHLGHIPLPKKKLVQSPPRLVTTTAYTKAATKLENTTNCADGTRQYIFEEVNKPFIDLSEFYALPSPAHATTSIVHKSLVCFYWNYQMDGIRKRLCDGGF